MEKDSKIIVIGHDIINVTVSCRQLNHCVPKVVVSLVVYRDN